MGEVTKEGMMKPSGWSYVHEPCTRCQSPTPHKTSLCSKCRTINCKDCGVQVVVHKLGLKHCGICVRRIKARRE